MSIDLSDIFAGLAAFERKVLDGAAQGLAGAAAGITLDMRHTTAHGDVTGATRANYTAYQVGRGRDGSAELQYAISAVEALNPGHTAIEPVQIDAEIGVILTSATDYQDKLETENAGQKAVLGPTLASSLDRLTRAAADGSNRALS